MHSGICEYVRGQIYFYNLPFDVRTFINNTIIQNQNVINHFTHKPLNVMNHFTSKPLNADATPYAPSNNDVTETTPIRTESMNTF